MSYTRLTRDFYQAVEALMEGKVEEKLDPQASEGGGSEPKTDKHKKLAAMGHPKDKITHKDVLIARGVVAKEELLTQEEFDELSEEDQVLYLEALDQLDEKDHMKNGYNYRPKNTAPSPQAKARYKEKVSTYKEEAELEEGKETEQMMVKSFKPEVVKALDKRGVTKHAPYRNPGLEKLAAQKKAMKEDAEEQLDELQENISNKHKVGDVYQPHLVDHIKNKTGTKVYFDGDDMVHEKTGKTIMNVKAHHTVGDAISAVKNLKEEAEQLDEIGDTPAGKKALGSYVKKRTKQLPSIEIGRQMAEPGRQLRGYEKLKKKVNKGIGRAVDRLTKEEVQEEVDQIITENNSFEIEVPARLTYKDYLDAAMQFVDAEDALTVAEAFYNEQDESLVIESFVRSDIEQKVAVHQKAGNQVSMPKFGTKDGKPYAEYVVTNKDDGIRRKYIHHGTMRRVENMGARGKKDAD